MGDAADDMMFREIGLPNTEFFTGKKTPMTNTKALEALNRISSYATDNVPFQGIEWNHIEKDSKTIRATLSTNAVVIPREEIARVKEILQCAKNCSGFNAGKSEDYINEALAILSQYGEQR